MFKYIVYRFSKSFPASKLRFIKELKSILGFYPKNIELFELALTHSSFVKKDRKLGIKLDNERLEFLGDAIFSAVISDKLYKMFPYKKENLLTPLRASLISRKELKNVGLRIGLEKILKVDKNVKSNGGNIVSNAFEALVAAIYLERGMKGVDLFVDRLIAQKYIVIDLDKIHNINFRGKLLEWSSKNKTPVKLEVKKIFTPNNGNNPKYVCFLRIKGLDEKFIGTGRNKKEAEEKPQIGLIVLLIKRTYKI